MCNSYLGRHMPSLQTSPFPSSFSSFYIAQHDIVWHGMSLQSAGVSCPSRVPSQLLVHPQPTHWWGRVTSRKGLNCVNTAEQWRKHPCVIHSVFSTNPNHSPILATMKKINSTPAKTSTEAMTYEMKFLIVTVDLTLVWLDLPAFKNQHTGDI